MIEILQADEPVRIWVGDSNRDDSIFVSIDGTCIISDDVLNMDDNNGLLYMSVYGGNGIHLPANQDWYVTTKATSAHVYIHPNGKVIT